MHPKEDWAASCQGWEESGILSFNLITVWLSSQWGANKNHTELFLILYFISWMFSIENRDGCAGLWETKLTPDLRCRHLTGRKWARWNHQVKPGRSWERPANQLPEFDSTLQFFSFYTSWQTQPKIIGIIRFKLERNWGSSLDFNKIFNWSSSVF